MAQPDNGIHIRGWYHDLGDKELEKLLPFLKGLVTRAVPDVRPELRAYRHQHPGSGLPYSYQGSPVRPGMTSSGLVQPYMNGYPSSFHPNYTPDSQFSSIYNSAQKRVSSGLYGNNSPNGKFLSPSKYGQHSHYQR
jgi:NLI interacting factor-like phosphatase